jgi:hypothetical protein
MIFEGNFAMPASVKMNVTKFFEKYQLDRLFKKIVYLVAVPESIIYQLVPVK